MTVAAPAMDPLVSMQEATLSFVMDADADGVAEQVAEQEPVIAAALLVAVAFRMKDERGLVTALRELSAAVDALTHGRDDD